MQTGKYIKNRLLPELIRKVCARQGLAVDTYSDDWVIRVSRDDKFAWIYGYHFDINGGAANEIANDKVATYLALTAAGIPAIAHYLVRSAARENVRLTDVKNRIPRNKRPFVIKPLTGSSGQNLQYVDDLVTGIEVVRRSGEAAWAASPYEDISKEFRVIILEGHAELLYEKTHPVVQGSLRLFNLGLGAKAQDVPSSSPYTSKLADLAVLTCSALKLRLAAVDIVELSNGEAKVLEVNSGISFEHYGRQSQENHQKAMLVYERVLNVMFSAAN